jgi:hypothetical protein
LLSIGFNFLINSVVARVHKAGSKPCATLARIFPSFIHLLADII